MPLAVSLPAYAWNPRAPGRRPPTVRPGLVGKNVERSTTGFRMPLGPVPTTSSPPAPATRLWVGGMARRPGAAAFYRNRPFSAAYWSGMIVFPSQVRPLPIMAGARSESMSNISTSSPFSIRPPAGSLPPGLERYGAEMDLFGHRGRTDEGGAKTCDNGPTRTPSSSLASQWIAVSDRRRAGRPWSRSTRRPDAR